MKKKESYSRVKKLLKDNDKKLKDLASELIKHETLNGIFKKFSL